MQDAKEAFPVDALSVRKVSAREELNLPTVVIDLEPFDLLLRHNGAPDETIKVETSVVLPLPDLGIARVTELEGQIRSFPVNPEPGYIDGSVYIDSRHHPVDVTEMTFGKIEGDSLPVSVVARLILEYETLAQYGDTDWHFDTALPVVEIDRVLSGEAAAENARLKAERVARRAAEAKAKG